MLLTESLDRLAAFEPVPFPVISLYLNMQADDRGRDRYESFLRQALRERLQTYRLRTPEHESFTRDIDRIYAYLDRTVRPSANGLAIFACAGADEFFEAVQLDAPIDEHRLFVADRPHLYPLARLNDQFPRYAAVVLDTNYARIFVFGTGQLQRQDEVESPKTKQTKVGGWSQARYQRHVGEYHQQHVKEVVDVLGRVVRAEGIQHILVGADEVATRLLKEELPPHLSEMLVDVLRLDIAAPEKEVFSATLEALRRKDAETDAQAVDRLFDAVRAGGLGVLGAEATLQALRNGQVDELIITARPELMMNVDHLVPAPPGQPPTQATNIGEGLQAIEAAAQAAAEAGDAPPETVLNEEKVADLCVTLARQTAAHVRFIEDPELLAEVGGVGALLRFTL
jgi:peptide chain release factor subunit 1